MVQQKRLLLFGGGLMTVLLAALMLGGSFRQPAQAQPAAPAPPPAVGRYQISSFGYRWSDGAACGAGPLQGNGNGRLEQAAVAVVRAGSVGRRQAGHHWFRCANMASIVAGVPRSRYPRSRINRSCSCTGSRSVRPR